MKKGVSGAGGEATSLELLDGALLVHILTCRGGLPFTGPCSGTANTVRGGRVERTEPLKEMMVQCENHVRELRTFFTAVLEPNIHTFSVLSETLPDFFKSKLC